MAKNTDNRNRPTRVKVRPANVAAERPARRQPPKKQGGGAATVLLILLVVLMFAALAGWLVKVALGNDRKEIKPQTSAVSSEESLAPAESVDVGALTQNFTYVTVNSKQMNYGPLGLYSEDLGYPAPQLESVYSSLFNSEGLQIASAADSKMKADKALLQPLNQMLSDFYDKTGLRTIMLTQAYTAPQAEKDPQYTEGYYDDYGNWVEPQLIEQPAEEKTCADHEDGLEIDLGLYLDDIGGVTAFDGSGDYAWFAENAYKYGFVLRYPEGADKQTGYAYNAAHFRYVGRAAAAVMQEQGLTFEEFQEYIKSYSFDSPLSVQTSVGCQVLYYIADSGTETTDVQIPADGEGNECPYIISGNNSDGYIVTVAPTEEFVLSVGAQGDGSSEISNDTNAE